MTHEERQAKKLKRILKKIGTRKSHDPLVSPFEDTRITYDRDDCEGCTERFVITNYDNESDHDIIDWLWDEYAYRISVPWDCSGQWFTVGFRLAHIKGTNKIIVLHYVGLDV